MGCTPSDYLSIDTSQVALAVFNIKNSYIWHLHPDRRIAYSIYCVQLCSSTLEVYDDYHNSYIYRDKFYGFGNSLASAKADMIYYTGDKSRYRDMGHTAAFTPDKKITKLPNNLASYILVSREWASKNLYGGRFKF